MLIFCHGDRGYGHEVLLCFTTVIMSVAVDCIAGTGSTKSRSRSSGGPAGLEGRGLGAPGLGLLGFRVVRV